MNILIRATDYVRSPGDPKVIEAGASVRPVVDQAARTLGWFSLALGAAELFAAPSLARMLGIRGKENLIRAFGVREIMAGMTTLSTEKPTGLWSRFGGDLLDIAALCAVYRDDNPKKQNVGLALATVLGITLIDLVAAKESSIVHGRGSEKPRDFSDRSGFPNGLSAVRGAARSENPA